MTSSAQTKFTEIYRSHMWRIHSGQPLSGGGSTHSATNVTCAVLLHAVRAVAAQRPTCGCVRVLDAPCGDFTWMPSCLHRMAQMLLASPPAGTPPTTIVYRGVDVVSTLVDQLNARSGNMLTLTRADFAMPAAVTLLPFLRLDVSNASAMRPLVGEVDVIVSKHMLIHTPNAHIERTLQTWNSLGASHLVRDNTWPHRFRNLDIQMGGGRDVDLHSKPFFIGPPQCASFDSGLCAAEGKCNDSIELYRMPLRPFTTIPSSLTQRHALMANVKSCT